jgi:hypothetical protein
MVLAVEKASAEDRAERAAAIRWWGFGGVQAARLTSAALGFATLWGSSSA